MKICYFGNYKPEEGRNRIYLTGFKRLGVEIIECRTEKKGIAKYVDLIYKHSKIKNDYDVMIVGYPGHAVVPLAKLISKKKVIFDALCTMYEGVIISRKQFIEWSPKTIYIKIIDWLAVRFADVVLVETIEQKKYFEKKFGRSNKYKVIYTGADDDVFYKDEKIQKKEKFTVIFRGRFLPEAGVKYIIESAKILKNDVNFLIMGGGYLEKEIKSQIVDSKLTNITLLSKMFSNRELREAMLSCHVSLGQFENHPRLRRTIPHKCFETIAMGLPYITVRTVPVSEILADMESCLFVNSADPADLAEKILLLKNNSALREKIADNGYLIYKKRFTPEFLTRDIITFI